MGPVAEGNPSLSPFFEDEQFLRRHYPSEIDDYAPSAGGERRVWQELETSRLDLGHDKGNRHERSPFAHELSLASGLSTLVRTPSK